MIYTDFDSKRIIQKIYYLYIFFSILRLMLADKWIAKGIKNQRMNTPLTLLITVVGLSARLYPIEEFKMWDDDIHPTEGI